MLTAREWNARRAQRLCDNARDIGGTATFSNTRNLSFSVDKSTSGCPDLHGTIPLYLYNSANQIVASVQAPLHGTGCAFDPLTGIATVSGSSESR